jgi:transcriptional regulator with XRE-family HTH domain
MIFKWTNIYSIVDIEFLSFYLVKQLIDKEKVEIGKRIRNLRELLSLTQKELGDAVGISKGTIVSIEAGKGFTGEYILAIGHFFGMELSELSAFRSPLPDEYEFRKHIILYHQRNNSIAYKILENPPNLNSLIEFRLCKTDFLSSKHRSVREIIDFFKTEYNLTFQSSVVSQALINATNDGILNRIKDGRKYLYKAVVVTK